MYHPATRRLGAIAIAACVSLVPSACGAEDDGGNDDDARSPTTRTDTLARTIATPAEADLHVVVRAGDGDEAIEYDVTCPPPEEGERKSAVEACPALERDAGMFEEVPTDVACTEIYGGPQTATVEGTFNGRKVDTSYKRTNGCEIARWDRAEALLGPPPQ